MSGGGTEGFRESGAIPANPLDEGDISLRRITEFQDLLPRLTQIAFRGVYTDAGLLVSPYASAEFSLATVYPPEKRGAQPTIKVHGQDEEHILWTPQPTIYANSSQTIGRVAQFLDKEGLSLTDLSSAVDYHWAGRGDFTILPPIIEAQKLPLHKDGKIVLDAFAEMFDGLYIPDSRQTRHPMVSRFLHDFFVDEVDSQDRFDIFNDSLKLLSYNYGEAGVWQYYIICDGTHRIDYAIEILGQPITVLLAEPAAGESLYPYYAMPTNFTPTTRLSSKKAEEIHPNLERDKVHTLASLIRKVLHYDWEKAGLHVSSLRSEQK